MGLLQIMKNNRHSAFHAVSYIKPIKQTRIKMKKECDGFKPKRAKKYFTQKPKQIKLRLGKTCRRGALIFIKFNCGYKTN